MKWILFSLFLLVLFLTIFFKIHGDNNKKLIIQGNMVQNNMNSEHINNQPEKDNGSTNTVLFFSID
jgi:hypothetical protein